MTGYNPKFFTDLKIPLPQLSAAQNKLRAALLPNPKRYELTYTHFSVVLNKQRRFAFFTASNIDGKSWKAAVAQGMDFSTETRVLATEQTGNELYQLHSGSGNDDFDKGHIVKFQDPQWGTEAEARQAAADTMHFVNCVPQHQSLNRGAWKSLEDYIVKSFTRKTGTDGQKVTVFAGPVLLANDPSYIDPVGGKPLQIPVHFWKVVVYKNRRGVYSAAAFLMSQRNLLVKHGLVVEKAGALQTEAPDFFADFTRGEPYQVRIDFIEKITGIKFGLKEIYQPYTKEEPTEVIYKRVEVPSGVEALAQVPFSRWPLNFTFAHITL